MFYGETLWHFGILFCAGLPLTCRTFNIAEPCPFNARQCSGATSLPPTIYTHFQTCPMGVGVGSQYCSLWARTTETPQTIRFAWDSSPLPFLPFHSIWLQRGRGASLALLSCFSQATWQDTEIAHLRDTCAGALFRAAGLPGGLLFIPDCMSSVGGGVSLASLVPPIPLPTLPFFLAVTPRREFSKCLCCPGS